MNAADVLAAAVLVGSGLTVSLMASHAEECGERRQALVLAGWAVSCALATVAVVF